MSLPSSCLIPKNIWGYFCNWIKCIYQLRENRHIFDTELVRENKITPVALLWHPEHGIQNPCLTRLQARLQLIFWTTLSEYWHIHPQTGWPWVLACTSTFETNFTSVCNSLWHYHPCFVSLPSSFLPSRFDFYFRQKNYSSWQRGWIKLSCPSCCKRSPFFRTSEYSFQDYLNVVSWDCSPKKSQVDVILLLCLWPGWILSQLASYTFQGLCLSVYGLIGKCPRLGMWQETEFCFLIF